MALIEMAILRSAGAFRSRDFPDECKMATYGGNEKQSLGSFVKSQTKYGTTTTVVSKNIHSAYVKHTVAPGDTLARLALKYSVSVEQIKRDNKLWSNDSLFLKEFVFIPVTKDNSESLPENCDIVNTDVVRAALDLSHHRHEKSDTESEKLSEVIVHRQTNGSVSRGADEIESVSTGSKEKASTTKASPLDFLSKYDSSIAQLKTNVQKMEQNAAFLEKDFPMMAAWYPRRHTEGNTNSPGRSRTRRHHSYEIDADDSPILVIRSRTKDVKSSLERLEKNSDEFYQL